MTSLPIICAALALATGHPEGLAGLRAANLNQADAEPRLRAFVEATPTGDPNRLSAMVALQELAMARGDYPGADQWSPLMAELTGRPWPHLSADLRGSPAPTATVVDETLPLEWGLMGLPRVDARFGAARVSALIDTGAQYAVVTESVARQAGLRELASSIRVGGASGQVSGGRLALTDIVMGQSRFTNAVVLIVPDSALTFPLGLKIEAIIGMPQLRAFEAVEFGPRSVRTYPVAPPSGPEQPNLAFDGWRLMAPVSADGEAAWMLFDTGARRSVLYVDPDTPGAPDGTITARGLGGARQVQGESERGTLTVHGRDLQVRAMHRRVRDRPSEGCTSPGPRSLLGQDALRQTTYRINFSSMRLDWVSPTRSD